MYTFGHQEQVWRTFELASLASGIAGKIKGETVDATAPFEGMNMILVGDFHQFPPPGCSALQVLLDIPFYDFNLPNTVLATLFLILPLFG